MHSGLILCVRLVWLKRISIQSTLEETQVNESINNDHVNPVVSQESTDEQKTIWVAEPVLEYPEWDYECFHCGTETEEHERYLRNGECYCDSCAYDLFEQPKPNSKYTDEMWEKFDKMAQINLEESDTKVVVEEDPEEDVWEDLAKIIFKEDIITCSICGDQEEKRYSWRYKCTVYCNVCAMEHCNKIIDKPRAIVEEFASLEEDNYDTYYSNKALCVTCGEVNYAEPVCEVEGRSRMVCCDCIEIVNHCEECHNLTLDYLYLEEDYNGVRSLDIDLCFECKFKRPLKEQMPLAVHLAIRSDIQFLTRQQFDILADYAELCEFTIFDAYRYKSRCHFYDCDRMVPPSQWNAEEAIQFCCRRHCDISELNGCHYQNVYDGSDYDEDWEQATCKVCNNSNHDTNMIPRIALRESDQGIKPIVSAICVFEEGIKMSNVLTESLVDLCEYFI